MAETPPPHPTPLPPRSGRVMTLAIYRLQNQRSQAWLSRQAQIRSGIRPLMPERPMTDELLAHLTERDFAALDVVWPKPPRREIDPRWLPAALLMIVTIGLVLFLIFGQ